VPHEHGENADTPTASISLTNELLFLDPLENNIGGKRTIAGALTSGSIAPFPDLPALGPGTGRFDHKADFRSRLLREGKPALVQTFDTTEELGPGAVRLL
jgi:hypothetical protein